MSGCGQRRSWLRRRRAAGEAFAAGWKEQVAGGGRCLWRLRVVAAGVPVAVSGDCSPCREVEASPEMRLPAHSTEARKGCRGQVGNAEDGRGVCLPLPAGKKAKRPLGVASRSVVWIVGRIFLPGCMGPPSRRGDGFEYLPGPGSFAAGRPLLPVCRLGPPRPLSLPPRRTAPRGRTCRAGRRGG